MCWAKKNTGHKQFPCNEGKKPTVSFNCQAKILFILWQQNTSSFSKPVLVEMSLKLHILIPSGGKWEKWMVLFADILVEKHAILKVNWSFNKILPISLWRLPFPSHHFLWWKQSQWSMNSASSSVKACSKIKCKMWAVNPYMCNIIGSGLLFFFCWEPFCIISVAASNGGKCKWDEPRAVSRRAGDQHCPCWGTTGCGRCTSHCCRGESAAALHTKLVHCLCSVCFHTPILSWIKRDN